MLKIPYAIIVERNQLATGFMVISAETHRYSWKGILALLDGTGSGSFLRFTIRCSASSGMPLYNQFRHPNLFPGVWWERGGSSLTINFSQEKMNLTISGPDVLGQAAHPYALLDKKLDF